MKELYLSIAEAYLCNGWSHRKIQEEIMGIEAPERGGGFEAMNVLHGLGIFGEHKNILNGEFFNKISFAKAGNLQDYLRMDIPQ